MTFTVNTPNHSYVRHKSGVYTIRNLETGFTTHLAGVDAFMLDLDLSGCALRAIDGVLARYEAVS